MTRLRPSRAGAELATAMCAAALAASGRSPGRLDASKEVVVTLPGTHRLGSVAVSRDGRGWAFLDARAAGVPASGPPTSRRASTGPGLGPQMAVHWLSDGSLLALALAPGPDGWVLSRDEGRPGTWPTAAGSAGTRRSRRRSSSPTAAALVPTSRCMAWPCPTAAWSRMRPATSRGPEFVEPGAAAWVIRRGRKLWGVTVRF